MRGKMMGRMAAVFMAVGLVSGEARADVPPPPPPPGLVWYVLNALNAFYLDVDDPTNRPPLVTEVPDGVLAPVEINGDGMVDWLIRWPESAQFCGTGGCRTTLYISAEDGFVRAFDRQTLSFEIRTVDGERRIEAGLHAVNCRDDAEECLRVWAWDAAAKRLRVVASSDGVDRPDEPPPVEDAGQGDD